ncbi:boule homolog, RNA binding protein isoform X2 [Haemaphysalis longicornis]
MTTTSSSTDSSSSSSPAGLNAPRYGTMVPNRVFVGGIATTTTEAELQELFSLYGHVTNTKIIVDRAGVSKGYGFVTFDTPEGAQRAQAAGNNNLMLRDRRLNVAPAIKKQPFTSRAYESVQQATPTGTVVYHQNGVPYMYHNGTAFFHHPDTFYQYAPQAAAQNLQASSAAVATTSSPAATTTGYPILYQPYYPQQAFQYPNAWSAPNGQWRWAPPGGSGGTPPSPCALAPSTSPVEPEGVVHSTPPQPYLAASHPAASQPAYFYPAVMNPGLNQVPSVEGQEYHDPAIVETGSEVGAASLAVLARKQDDGGGTSPTPSSFLASTSTSLSSFWTKGACSPGASSCSSPPAASAGARTEALSPHSSALPGSPPPPALFHPPGGSPPPAQLARRPRELGPRQRRYTAPPDALLSLEDCAQGGERDLPAGHAELCEPAKRGGHPGASWRDCLFGTPPTPAAVRSQCP